MQLLGMSEAARRLGVYPDTILNWEKRGLIKPMRDSAGRRLFTEEQIEELAREREQTKKGAV